MSSNHTEELDAFLELRNHLKIAHHIPGRIRLKAAISVVNAFKKVDSALIDHILGAIHGIEKTEVNMVARSVIVTYSINDLKPEWWDILIKGKQKQAEDLLHELLNAG